MRISILIPYYGKWPDYFELYLKGLRANDWFDVIFVTDLELPVTAPPNAKRIQLTKQELITLTNQRIGVSPYLNDPYKLCDLRPAFAHIFHENLKGYDFWGWGDIDLIYGNILNFYSLEDFNQYDVITGRKHWVSGGLTFLRNIPQVNELYLSSDHYQEVFSSPKHYSYSECGKVWAQLINGVDILEMNLPYPNFTQMVWKAQSRGILRIKSGDFFKESLAAGLSIKFSNGSINQSGMEYLLFHYVMNKRKPWFIYPDWEIVPDEFYITETGFYRPEDIPAQVSTFKELFRKLPFPKYWMIHFLRKAKRLIS